MKFYQVGVCNGWGGSNELAHGLFNYFTQLGITKVYGHFDCKTVLKYYILTYVFIS